MLTCTINHAVKVKKVGVYQSIIELIDDATGEQITYIERDHPKREREGVAKSSLKEAREIAEEKGYKVSVINSTDYKESSDEESEEEAEEELY